jgi:hypothetical protein
MLPMLHWIAAVLMLSGALSLFLERRSSGRMRAVHRLGKYGFPLGLGILALQRVLEGSIQGALLLGACAVGLMITVLIKGRSET